MMSMPPRPADAAPPGALPRWVHPLWVGAVVVPALVATAVYFGVIMAALATSAIAGAFAGWLSTTYRRPLSAGILPWYVLGVVALLIQAWEQWAGGYAGVLVALFPEAFAAPVVFDEARWLHIFPLATTVVFLLGAVALLNRHPVGGYLAWLVFACAAVLALSHPVLLTVAGELRYVPGMLSAAPLAAVAVAGFLRLRTDREEGLPR